MRVKTPSKKTSLLSSLIALDAGPNHIVPAWPPPTPQRPSYPRPKSGTIGNTGNAQKFPDASELFLFAINGQLAGSFCLILANPAAHGPNSLPWVRKSVVTSCLELPLHAGMRCLQCRETTSALRRRQMSPPRAPSMDDARSQLIEFWPHLFQPDQSSLRLLAKLLQ